MKKILILLLVLTLPLLSGCGLKKVPAGYVGVKVYLLGTSKGVDTEEIGVGRYWLGINEELYLFPTFQQNYVWTKDKNEGSPNDESITFQTKEGMECNADIGISYHLNPTKVNSIFQKYRKGIGEITDIFLRNNVRDSLVKLSSSLGVEDVYGAGKAELINNVQNDIIDSLKDTGIEIDKIYWIGSIRLPQAVIGALNEKVQATQRAQQRENELREAEAEAKKQIAKAEGEAKAILAKAEAEAKANKTVAASITPSLIQYEQIKKWDGKLPQVSGGATPFVDLRDK